MQMLYVASFLAFAMTLILMYLVLRKYTFPAVEQPFFSDPSLFGLFAVGLVAGTFMFMGYTYFYASINIIIVSVLFAILECLVLLAVLNLKRYHGKSDTVFLGYGLGLGIGCTTMLGTFYYFGTSADITEAVDYAIMFVMSVSHLFMLSALGTIIGEGVARLRPMEFMLQAAIANVAYYIILAAGYMNSDNESVFYACMVVALLVAFGFFYRTMYKNLSGVVRDVLKMEGKKRNVP